VSRRSLTFRLVSWYCGLLFVLGVAFALFTFASFHELVDQSNRATLKARTEAVWGIGRDLLGDKAALGRLIEQRFAPEAQSRFIRISDGDTTYYQSGSPIEHEFDPSSVPPVAAATPQHLIKIPTLFLYAMRFESPDGRMVTVESGLPSGFAESADRHLMISLVIGLPLLLLFAAGGGYALVHRALAPVETMIEAAETFTFNAPSKRLPLAGTEDRIDALGRALNRMLERLDGAYQQASRFSADAAHELRTPLAIMRGELELLAARGGLSADALTALGNVLSEAVRLSQIVESLIGMSRLDSVGGKRAHRAVDLQALAAETIDHMRLLADEKSIALVLHPAPPAMAAGDRDRLKQVLVNLLDNAIKYTNADGSIAVMVAETADSVLIEVRDTGIGIAAEHLPHIFERFYRASTDRGEVGAGLGLAIVRAICTAHGGTVQVESQPEHGSALRVVLPRATGALVVSDGAETLSFSPPPDR
jgi:signal transduction histidine kinase